MATSVVTAAVAAVAAVCAAVNAVVKAVALVCMAVVIALMSDGSLIGVVVSKFYKNWAVSRAALPAYIVVCRAGRAD